jgi:arylsulfatase A-like enzyme
MDTVRADHCSVYGFRGKTTPVLEELASEGLLFEQAYAPTGITGPSHATLFTGLHVITHGVVKNGLLLEDQWVTLAEQLSGEGYETAGFVSSFPLDRKFGYAQGFHHYDDEFVPGQNSIDAKTWEGTTLENAFDRKGQFTTDKALGWLSSRKNQDQPFFMFVHYFDAHSPYEPHEGFETMLDGIESEQALAQQILLYDQEIAKVDREIGRVVDALKKTDGFENTIIIITADHGEGLMDHGCMIHAATLHEEEIRVPLIIHNPSRYAQRTIQHPVGLMDIVATVAGMVGYDANNFLDVVVNNVGKTVDHGLDVFLPHNQVSERPMYFYRRHYDAGMMQPGWDGTMPDGTTPKEFKVYGEQYGIILSREKYIVDPELGIQQFFQLETDPIERTNLYQQNSTRAQVLHKKLEQWVGDNRLENAPEISTEADQEALEALGYVNQ